MEDLNFYYASYSRWVPPLSIAAGGPAHVRCTSAYTTMSSRFARAQATCESRGPEHLERSLQQRSDAVRRRTKLSLSHALAQSVKISLVR